MTAVMTDLHWLIHQGHVIEFANGVLETAKKPLPRPPKPAKAPAENPAAAPTEPAAAEALPSAEALGAESPLVEGAEMPPALSEPETPVDPVAKSEPEGSALTEPGPAPSQG